MCTPRSDEIADRLSQLFTRRASPAVVSVYLYGSHLTDRSHRESDVDVGILLRWDVCPTPRDRLRERADTAFRLEAEFGGRPVDVVVFNDAPAGFGRHIVTSCRRVYCADAEVDHAGAVLREAGAKMHCRTAKV